MAAIDRPAEPAARLPGVRRLFGVLILAALVTTLAAILFVAGGIVGTPWYRLVTIDGGSMAPAISRGDLILVAPAPSQVRPGMVLVLRVGDEVVTHRVVAVDADGSFVTRGDANAVNDDWTSQQVEVTGLYVATIPWLGNLVSTPSTSTASFVDRVSAGMLITVGPFAGIPVAAPTQAPPANGNGWNNTDVVVTWHWSTTGAPIDTSHCTLTSTSVGEGTLTLTASCKDTSGNTGTASYTVKVDKTAPAVAITAHPSNPSSSSSATFTFSASDTAGSGIATLTCKLDGGAAAPCATATSQAYAGLANGTHTFTIVATDLAGNSTTVSFTWCLSAKSKGPSITVSHVADGPNGWNRTALVALVITVTPGTAAVTKPPACTDNGHALTVTGSASPYAAAVTGDGTHAISCKVTDTAGASATGTDTVKLDTVKPKVTVPANISVGTLNASGLAVTYTATFSDATSGIATSGCTPKSGSTFPIGTTTVTCSATDKAGNTQSSTFTVTVTSATARQAKLDTLAGLQAELGCGGSSDTRTRLSSAIGHLKDSLVTSLWVMSGPLADGNHLDHVNGGKVFDAEKAAITSLMAIRNPSAAVKAAIATLDAADQLLAQTALNDAIAAHGDPAKIAAAQKEMTSAQGDMASGHFDRAVDHWKSAWRDVTP